MTDTITLVDDALKTMRNLRPGQRYLYFTGYLEKERYDHKGGAPDLIAAVAYDLMQAGRIHLIQKRMGPPITKDGNIDWREGSGQGFEYYAVGALPKKRIPKFYVVEGSSKVMA